MLTEEEIIKAVALALNEAAAPVEPPWKCPICNHSEYTTAGGVWNGIIGPASHVDGSYFACENCTVHFSNPDKFNKLRLEDRREHVL